MVKMNLKIKQKSKPMIGYVTLDALIPREDMQLIQVENNDSSEINKNFKITINIQNLIRGDGQFAGFSIAGRLRKPDFQRETDNWTPEQIKDMIEAQVNGYMVPSVIIWNSGQHSFVIDGAHRLSALLAWINDDYGYGKISREYFKDKIPESQQQLHDYTKKLVDESVGKFDTDNPKINADVLNRELFSQVYSGYDPKKAEDSFFKINQQGTKLSNIESLILKNRHTPMGIGARSLMRAGTGNKYWSSFKSDIKQEIEDISSQLYQKIYSPELKPKIIDINLPVGGSAKKPDGLTLLWSFFELVNDYNNNTDNAKFAKKYNFENENDVEECGKNTIEFLKNINNLISLLFTKEGGSLGLHPAIYFYNEEGKHNPELFLGMIKYYLHEKINNKNFPNDFIKFRGNIENKILANKQLFLKTRVEYYRSEKRVDYIGDFIRTSIKLFQNNPSVTIKEIFKELKPSFEMPEEYIERTIEFNKKFLRETLKGSKICSICGGYMLDKDITDDHIIPKKNGGSDLLENLQFTHAYCNNQYKN